MKKVFIAGAGLSSSCLIDYMLEKSINYNWKILVGDLDTDLANKKIKNHPNGKAIFFDIGDEELRNDVVSKVDLVISLLPASLHYLINEACLRFGKNIITASYIPDDLWRQDREFSDKGIMVLYECGLDPGIDHMSAMQVIDRIRDIDGKLLSFKSCAGGLVAPEHDNNPWNYKFTWNPRNIVFAGKDGAQYKENGKLKSIPYHRIFERSENIEVEGDKNFEIYPNRNSLKYIYLYGLDNIGTIYRGTIRRSGFSNSWNHLIQLGLTSDNFDLENTESMTYRELTDSFLPTHPGKKIEEKLAEYLSIEIDSEDMNKLKWLGIFEDKKIELSVATPAKALQKLLEDKWIFKHDDKDMIVMQHEFIYENKNQDINKITTSLIVEGHDKDHTAMAMTVGLPLGIAAKLFLTGKIDKKGISIPVTKEFYEPILEELEKYNIKFTEQEEQIKKGS